MVRITLLCGVLVSLGGCAALANLMKSDNKSSASASSSGSGKWSHELSVIERYPKEAAVAENDKQEKQEYEFFETTSGYCRTIHGRDGDGDAKTRECRAPVHTKFLEVWMPVIRRHESDSKPWSYQWAVAKLAAQQGMPYWAGGDQPWPKDLVIKAAEKVVAYQNSFFATRQKYVGLNKVDCITSNRAFSGSGKQSIQSYFKNSDEVHVRCIWDAGLESLLAGKQGLRGWANIEVTHEANWDKGNRIDVDINKFRGGDHVDFAFSLDEYVRERKGTKGFAEIYLNFEYITHYEEKYDQGRGVVVRVPIKAQQYASQTVFFGGR